MNKYTRRYAKCDKRDRERQIVYNLYVASKNKNTCIYKNKTLQIKFFIV